MMKILDENINKVTIIAAIVVALLIFTISYVSTGNNEAVVKNGTADDLLEEYISPFSKLALEADAVYVYDIKKNKVLFSAFEDRRLPLASLAKIMTAITALSYAENNIEIEILAEDLAQEGDTGLLLDERWRLKDLTAFTLMTSSNDGAHAIARKISALGNNSFINLMNILAGDLGLENTYFLNASGLDLSEKVSGGYGTAEEVAKLLAFGYKNFPSVFSATSRKEKGFVSISGIKHLAKNTNEWVHQDVGLISSKTGFTDLAGGNLAVVFDAGPARPIAAVVLGSTTEGRFTDIKALMKATFSFIATQ